MTGSSAEPTEEPVAANGGGLARPDWGSPLAARWAMWRHDPRLVTAGLALIALAAGGWWVRLSVAEPSNALSSTTHPRTTTRTTGVTSATFGNRVTPTSVGVFVVDV